MSDQDQPSSTSTKRRRALKIKGRFRFTRDGLLFAGGLIGVFHETVFTKADRPTLLLLFAAMMGLPAFLRTDERKPPGKK